MDKNNRQLCTFFFIIIIITSLFTVSKYQQCQYLLRETKLKLLNNLSLNDKLYNILGNINLEQLHFNNQSKHILNSLNTSLKNQEIQTIKHTNQIPFYYSKLAKIIN